MNFSVAISKFIQHLQLYLSKKILYHISKKKTTWFVIFSFLGNICYRHFTLHLKIKIFWEMVQTGCRQTLRWFIFLPSYGHLKSMVTYQRKLMTTHPKTCWCICFGFRFSDLIWYNSLWVTPSIQDLSMR